jgi:hypothetical protein
MNLLAEAITGLGAVLLPVAAALLLEELTFGGLVRLLLAPRPGTRGPRRAVLARWGEDTSKRREHNHSKGGGKCSH